MANSFWQIYCMTLSSLTPSLPDSWPLVAPRAKGSCLPCPYPGLPWLHFHSYFVFTLPSTQDPCQPPGLSAPALVLSEHSCLQPCPAWPHWAGVGMLSSPVTPRGERGVSRVFISCWDLSHGLFGCCFALCTEILCVSQTSRLHVFKALSLPCQLTSHS